MMSIILICEPTLSWPSEKSAIDGEWMVSQLSQIDQRIFDAAAAEKLLSAERSATSGDAALIRGIWVRYQQRMLGLTEKRLASIAAASGQRCPMGSADGATDPWLRIGLKPVETWKVDGRNLAEAMQIGRALVYAGKPGMAVAVLNQVKAGVVATRMSKAWGAVLACEAFAENQHWDRVIASAQYGLELLDPQDAEAEYFSGEERELPPNVIAVATYELKRLRDFASYQQELENYGEAFVLYREADRARLIERDLARAWQSYEQVRRQFPGTVMAEAAEAYGIATLVLFAGSGDAAELKQRISALSTKTERLGRALADLKNLGASPSAIQAQADALASEEARLDSLLKLPLRGDETAALASKLGEAFLARSPDGLYRGEALVAMGDLAWEVHCRCEEGRAWYHRARIWFETIAEKDDALAQLDIEPRLARVAAPPASMHQIDAWGNVSWSSTEPGMILNQRTASWYLDYWKIRACLREMSCAAAMGDQQAALELLRTVANADPHQRQLEAKGYPSIAHRLADDIKERRFFATQEEIAAFPARVRPRLLVAELAYETERYDDARNLYEEIRKDFGDRLGAAALAYLDYHQAIALVAKDRARALDLLGSIAAMDPIKVPTWHRARMDLFVLTQTLAPDGGGCLKHLDAIMEKLPGSLPALQAAYTKASFLAARDRRREATDLFRTIMKCAPGTWMAEGSARFLQEMGN